MQPADELSAIHAALVKLLGSVDETDLGPEDRELLRRYLHRFNQRTDRPSGIELSNSSDLRPRHRETLELLMTGASEKEIAAALGISVHTVHQYVKAIYRRFRVKSRAQLMASRIRLDAP